jgi:hypothetical protein
VEGVRVDRSNPYVFGGVVVDGDGAMEGRKLEPPGHWHTEPLPPAPDQLEESVVYLGTLYTDTQASARPPGTMGGRVWGRISGWLGGDD